LLVELIEEAVELRLARVVVELGRDVAHALHKALPDFVAEGIAGVLPDRRLHSLPELVVRHLAPRHADARELLWQQALVRERVDRGDQFALGEVTRRAEDDEHARIRRPADDEPFEERVVERLGHSLWIAWPPNSLRSAATIFAAYDSSSRE